jgi:uncharacterized RDD family membrane protein YckC
MRAPLPSPDYNYELYAGFGPRLCSLLLDGLFTSPLIIIGYFLQSNGKELYVFWVIVSIIFNMWYHVYLVAKNGGTPGKLIMGLKIARLDLETIGWREAVLRHIVEITLLLLSNLMVIYAIHNFNEAHYLALNWRLRGKYLYSFYPALHRYFTWLTGLWVWGELIVLLTNDKKRAVHDFIAGTVIVDINYLAMMEKFEAEQGVAPSELTE